MHKINYEIKLNDEGRPYIDLPLDYEHSAEDKFFALEMCRYLLQVTYNRMASPKYDQHTIDMMDTTIRLLGQIGDEVAELIRNNMESMGDMAIMMDNNYHIRVVSIEERDKLPLDNIFYDGKIFKRQIGLKVLVLSELNIYELKNDIENWVLIKGKDYNETQINN